MLDILFMMTSRNGLIAFHTVKYNNTSIIQNNIKPFKNILPSLNYVGIRDYDKK